MRGYHIRISLHRKSEISTSYPQTSAESSVFTPSLLFQPLPAHTPKSTARKNALFNPKHKDYRFGPIRIDWVDFETMSKPAYTAGKEKEQRGQTTATFVARTKAGSTNLPEGTVHIFRDSNKKSSASGEIEAAASSSPLPMDDAGGVTLGVLAVPSWMTPSDFLTFVAPAADGMSHLRMIRDSAPNRSMVIIQFPKAEDAAEFTEAYNGKPFNSMEPETCHVVRILSVNIDPDDTVSQAISRLGSAQPSMYELPTCPVCLERMDSAVTGLITVPCSHTFHCMCLSKWGDSRCPVCRYSQNLLSSHPTSSRSSVPIPFANPSTPSLSACVDCSSTTNLWICLICGNIGCGRYGRAHAQAHYERTTHLYALELETQRVWDYAGDGYVHRLIQNKADGKLVELPSASMGGSREGGTTDGGLGPSLADRLSAEKIEAIGIEYSYLLTSQLDSQRAYYEEQMNSLQSKVLETLGMVERLSSEIKEERAAVREEQALRKQEADARIAEAERDKIKAEKRADKLTEVAKRLEKELREERAVSEGLMKNLAKMKERVEQADKDKADFHGKIADLEDQVRDVMFFLDAKTKIERGDNEVSEAAGGSVEVPVRPPSPRATSKKKKGRK
ncbi:hypothetical protein PLICRDRAFT_44258 [Plicaturopsis crispa FD-325 SS-3]|nr:hypothetical protein PLICRDRAFT_44258 [Plicaturopsis crispa FD-325 SS-3]